MDSLVHERLPNPAINAGKVGKVTTIAPAVVTVVVPSAAMPATARAMTSRWSRWPSTRETDALVCFRLGLTR